MNAVSQETRALTTTRTLTELTVTTKLTWKTKGGNVDSQESESVEDEAGNVISVSNEMTITVDRYTFKYLGFGLFQISKCSSGLTMRRHIHA